MRTLFKILTCVSLARCLFELTRTTTKFSSSTCVRVSDLKSMMAKVAVHNIDGCRRRCTLIRHFVRSMLRDGRPTRTARARGDLKSQDLWLWSLKMLFSYPRQRNREYGICSFILGVGLGSSTNCCNLQVQLRTLPPRELTEDHMWAWKVRSGTEWPQRPKKKDHYRKMRPPRWLWKSLKRISYFCMEWHTRDGTVGDGT